MPSDVVFALCESVRPGDEEVRIVLLKNSFDLVLLPAWSSLEGLVAACGENQSWVSVRLQEMDGVRAAAGADAVLLDPQPAALP